MNYESIKINVGDRVKLTQYPSWGPGTLKFNKDSYGWYIELDTPRSTCHSAHGHGKENRCWFSYTFILLSEEKIFTKEERINNKCKLLWNKSKYVQKNPKLAY